MFPSASFPQMPNIYPMAIRHSKSRLFPLAVREVIDLYRDNGQEAPKQITIAASSMLLISIIRLSAKGTDGVMKRGCFRLKLMFAILFTGECSVHYRNRGEEWRSCIAATPHFYMVRPPVKASTNGA